MPNDVAESPMTGFESLDDAAKVGAGLRAVRERLGWALADVAAALRIRLPYLEAIERGDLKALPGAAYQTGFVRSYAQILGLDPEEILRRFRSAGLGAQPDPHLSFLAPVPDRAVPAGAVVLLGVVLVLAGYGLWYRHTEHERRLAAMVPSVPVELAPLAVPPKLPPPPVAKTVNVQPSAPAMKNPVPVADQPGLSAVPTTTQSAVPTTTQTALPTATQAALPATTQTALPATTQTALPATTQAALPAASQAALPPGGMTIMATQDDWVQVQDATGTILFSKVLHEGESWPVPDEAGLTMIAGNAGGTEIVTNGQPGPPLGAAGAVLRDYPLTPPAAPATPAAAVNAVKAN
ncbi:MAG: DUF4115 domain-containing protein [Acidocella sp.]|nr:DUF4115 domain-containing protein [Acidocella sp.]